MRALPCSPKSSRISRGQLVAQAHARLGDERGARRPPRSSPQRVAARDGDAALGREDLEAVLVDQALGQRGLVQQHLEARLDVGAVGVQEVQPGVVAVDQHRLAPVAFMRLSPAASRLSAVASRLREAGSSQRPEQ